MYKQDPPFCVQIEPTEGCQLRCPFCGINGIRGAERTYKYMSVKTARVIASQMAAAGWTARVELAMHGETSLNPDIVAIVETFRHFLPRTSLLMLSNGGGLLPGPADKIKALFGAGLNTLAIEEYQNVKLVPKILEELRGVEWERARFYTYPDEPEGNPHTRQHHKARRLVHVRPIDLNTSGTHATLNNHAGAGAPKNESAQGKPCAKPFRELSFRWDGSVAVCCNDWRGDLPIGNIHKNTLEEIWNGEIMDAARRRLILGDRTFGPCKGCDALSYRTGLLPDKMGRATVPAPTPATDALLQVKRRPLTKAVKREWEK